MNAEIIKTQTGTFALFINGELHREYKRKFSAQSRLNVLRERELAAAAEAGAATKTNPVRLTDDYGNTATGKIHTETKIPKSNINRAVNAYVAANVAGSVVNSSHAEQAVKEMAAGNYDVAALQAAAALDFALNTNQAAFFQVLPCDLRQFAVKRDVVPFGALGFAAILVFPAYIFPLTSRG